MLPPILNSPEWLISPDCHKKWEGSTPPPLLPFCACMLMLGHHSILNCGHGGKDRPVREVLAGVQGAGPPGGGCKGEAPPCLRNFLFGGHKICNFITHFRRKLINTHTKLLRKIPLLKMKEQNN